MPTSMKNKITLFCNTSVVLFVLLSTACGVKHLRTSRSPCVVDKDDPNCSSSVPVITELRNNPDKVTLQGSFTPHIIKFSESDLSGFELHIPRDSYAGDQHLSIVMSELSDLGIADRFMRTLGLRDSEPGRLQLSIKGSQTLSKSATLLLPPKFFEGMKDSSLETMKIRVTNKKSYVVQRANIREEKTTDGKQSFAIKLNAWGIVTIDTDRTPPVLELSNPQLSDLTTATHTIELSASEQLEDFTVDAIKVNNGTIQSFQAFSRRRFRVIVEHFTSGPVTLSVGQYRDLSGNFNTSTFAATHTFDGSPPIPGSFGSIAVSGLSSGGATLTWSLASDLASPVDQLSYEVRIATTNLLLDAESTEYYGSIAVAHMANINSASVELLNPSTTYWVNVIVRDRVGYQAAYQSVSFATSADTIAPQTNSNDTIVASSITDESVTLAWTLATDNAPTASGLSYLVCSAATSAEVDTAAECMSATVARSWFAATSGNAVISGLIPSTAYYLNMVARDHANNRVAYTPVSITTASDVTPPIPGSFISAIGTTVGADLIWNPATDRGTAQSSLQYYVCRGTTLAAVESVAACESASQILNWTTDQRSVTDTSVTGAGLRYYNLLVRDAAGNKGAASVQTTTIIAGKSPVDYDRRSGLESHSIYDAVNAMHWFFYKSGGQIYYRRSTDGTNWVDVGSVAADLSTFTVAYKSASSQSWVYLVGTENSYDITLRRGTMTATSISFDSAVVAFDGVSATQRYDGGAITIDDNKVWIAANYLDQKFWNTVIRPSTNNFDQSLSAWSASVTRGEKSNIQREIVLMSESTNLYLFYKEGPALQAHKRIAGVWSSMANPTETAFLPAVRFGSIEGSIYDLTVFRGELIIAGAFKSAGGNTLASGLARWDGLNWQALTGGLSFSGGVSLLATLKDELYTCGGDGIFRWDGRRFQNVTDRHLSLFLCYGIRASENKLFMDISASPLGYVSPSRGIYEWDGTTITKFKDLATEHWLAAAKDDAIYLVDSSWTNLSEHTKTTSTIICTSSYINIYTWVIYNNQLVGGNYQDLCDSPSVGRIARWDGTAWTSMQSAFASAPAISDLWVVGSDLYITGSFSDAGGDSNADDYAKWNGTAWSGIVSGGHNTNTQGNQLASDGNQHFVISYYNNSVSFPRSVGLLQSGTWTYYDRHDPTSMSPVFTPEKIAIFAGDLYMAGNFIDLVSNTSIDHVARWDGTQWQPVGTGLTGAATEMVVYGSHLYVAGEFTSAGGVGSTAKIARWDGSTWSAVGGGLNGNVTTLNVNGSDLLVGGVFTNAGGNAAADYLARWDGTSWTSVVDTSAVTGSPTISDIAYIGTNLVLAGDFINFAGVTGANYVAMWNGSSWQAMGAEFNAPVKAIELFETELYAHTPSMLVKWTGTVWEHAGGPIFEWWNFQSVNDMHVSGGLLYVGGEFTKQSNQYDYRGAYAFDGNTIANLRLPSASKFTSIVSDGATVYVAGPSYIFKSQSVAKSEVKSFAVTLNDQHDPQLLALDTTRGANLIHQEYAGGAWSGTSTILRSGVSDPVLSSSANKLLAGWMKSQSFEYKVFDGSSWPSQATVLLNYETRASRPMCSQATPLTCVFSSIYNGVLASQIWLVGY